MTDEYRVPKHRIPVRVRMAGGEVRSVEMFVGARAQRHTGAERPSDRLNDESAFLPVEDEQEGFFLLNKPAVSVVTVDLDREAGPEPLDAEDEALLEPEGEEAAAAVRLVLDDGHEVRGLAAMLLPPGERRLLDLLNDADRFLRLRDGDRILLVNTAHIARAAPG